MTRSASDYNSSCATSEQTLVTHDYEQGMSLFDLHYMCIMELVGYFVVCVRKPIVMMLLLRLCVHIFKPITKNSIRKRLEREKTIYVESKLSEVMIIPEHNTKDSEMKRVHVDACS